MDRIGLTHEDQRQRPLECGGELSAAGRYEIGELLWPLVWFEKRRRDRDTKRATPGSDEGSANGLSTR